MGTLKSYESISCSMPKIGEAEYGIIAKAIIRKLYSADCRGKGHMLVDRFKHGLPGHFKGDVDSIVEDLVRKEIILVYGRTKHGLAVYLNKKKKAEIEQLRGN